MTIIDRWNFSWDLNPGPPQRIDGGNNSSWETWRYSSGKRKVVKLAQRRCISTSDIAYFSALATPLCLSARCYPSLSLQAIVPTERIVSEWKFQSIPFIFVATFNGIIRRILKLLADTNVVIEWGLLKPYTIEVVILLHQCVCVCSSDRASTLWSIIHLENKKMRLPIRSVVCRTGGGKG